jgi:thiamine kinase-like enzyme
MVGMALRRLRFGPRKLVATAIAVVTTGLLWIFTRDPAVTAVSVLIVSGLTALGIAIGKARRNFARQERSESRRVREAYTANINSHLELDKRLDEIIHPGTGRGENDALRTSRIAMAHGRGSWFINRVTVSTPGGSDVELVEKGVDTDSNELSFWRSVDSGALVLSGHSYRAVRPLDIVQGAPVSVLYFPYLPALDRERRVLQSEFRTNLPTIVKAVAEFNGRNTMPLTSLGGTSRYSTPPRPSVQELQLRLNLDSEDATDLLRSFDRVQREWSTIQDAYANLPHCLCHNDISPGNAVCVNGIITFNDFGVASGGPIGSDLHTIIRWSAHAMYDRHRVEELIATYVEAVRPYHTTTVADVRFAAWTTFYLRYTNLKFSSARYERPFRLALQQMASTIRDRALNR